MTSRRPRILLVGPFPPTTGGVTTFMLNLMRSQLAEQFEFLGFTTSRPPKKNVLDNHGYAAMFRGGIGRVIRGILVTAWHVFKFPFVVIGRRIDIVQIQASDFQAFWESAAYVVWSRLLGKPTIMRVGGSFSVFYDASPPWVRSLIGWVLKRPHCVIAQSAMWRSSLEKAGRDGKILILPNWSKDAGAVRTGPAAAAPVCVFLVGMDAKIKGTDEVLAAIKSLDAAGSPARFHILGVPPVLGDAIAALGVRNVVAVEGMVPNSRVLEAMKTGDIFLMPSRSEGFPNSLLEAMACGLPSIVTPVGAIPEIAKGGGMQIVPVGDAAALARQVDALARDGALRAQLGQEAHANLLSRYTADRVLPDLATLYLSLIPA